MGRALLPFMAFFAAFLLGCETVAVSSQDVEDVQAGRKVLLETGHINRLLSFGLNLPTVSIASVDGVPVTSPIFSKQQVPVLPGMRKVSLNCNLQYSIESKASGSVTEVDIRYEESMMIDVMPGFKYQISGRANVETETCSFDISKVVFPSEA